MTRGTFFGGSFPPLLSSKPIGEVLSTLVKTVAQNINAAISPADIADCFNASSPSSPGKEKKRSVFPHN